MTLETTRKLYSRIDMQVHVDSNPNPSLNLIADIVILIAGAVNAEGPLWTMCLATLIAQDIFLLKLGHTHS